MSLAAAHQGYDYQDLLISCRLVDMLLGNVAAGHVDKKLFPNDRFDDLTTIDTFGNRERIQIKYTADSDRPLTLQSFITDERDLRFDKLISIILADRDLSIDSSRSQNYRIILRDQPPNDSKLTSILVPLNPDPGPYIPALETIRFGFDAQSLWSHNRTIVDSKEKQPFSFIFTQKSAPSFDDLEWVCQHLIIEVNAPSFSGDLTKPDIAEQILMTRVRAEIGAGVFPNVGRSVIDVAASIISTTRAARQGMLEVTAEELLRRAQLRNDYGAVTRAHPVDDLVEVDRHDTVSHLVNITRELANIGGKIIIAGPPGHGKSWTCHQLLRSLSKEGWLTAEHYCYLGDADGERLERVLTEGIFGSLVGRLNDTDPRLAMDNRPRLAADEDALLGCINNSLKLEPNRKIALVIDGIDHITRVQVQNSNNHYYDPSWNLSETLSFINLPPNTVLIILSQPGPHLQPLEAAGAFTFQIPGLDSEELKTLAMRLNVIPNLKSDQYALSPNLIKDNPTINEFLEILTERSNGNALYATYLCREILRQADSLVDPVIKIRSLPSFDGTLKNYYDHIYNSLGNEAGWVADVISLVDFSISRAELCEIRPDAAHHVDKALALLEPVLIERATQGGLRIYHESFARYLRLPFQENLTTLKSLLGHLADWLDSKGFYTDPRAFKSLLTILSDAGYHERVIALIDNSFVVRAIAAGFPPAAIKSNLAKAIHSAFLQSNWSLIISYVEQTRAAETFQNERFDSTLVSFVDVPASLLGINTLANRLLEDDRLVMPTRIGLQMCAAIDKLGGTPPWAEYMLAFHNDADNDSIVYGVDSDRKVALAWFRGRLRLVPTIPEIDFVDYENSSNLVEIFDGISLKGKEWNPSSQIDWVHFVSWVEENDLPASEVISIIEDTHGINAAIQFFNYLHNPCEYYLAFAERLVKDPSLNDIAGTPLSWAIKATSQNNSNGAFHRLLKLGVDPSYLSSNSIEADRNQLFELTRKVQESSIQWRDGNIGVWLDACALSAYRDQLGLVSAEALIIGEGWYRCWLRFTIALLRAEFSEHIDQSENAIKALRQLTDDLNPFSGDPRSCDLLYLHGVIQDTIIRALCLLNDDDWKQGLVILKKVSASITTTLDGELGGPIPPDFLLLAAVNNVKTTTYLTVHELIEDEIANGSGGRYYSDLAEYRLYAARLALKNKDNDQARNLWQEACSFLIAYGWHKDITIYELLDPLPSLINADKIRARNCIAKLQGLCERIPLHTVKRETRHARSIWWEYLAKADPVAAVKLVVPKILAECNEPNGILSDVLENVWENWYKLADPFISGVLRLTLETPLHTEDANQFQLLVNDPTSNTPAMRNLLKWLLARVDERHVTYSFTNSPELVSKDDKEVAVINQACENFDLPPITKLNDKGNLSDKSINQNQNLQSEIVTPIEEALTRHVYQPGLSGLSQAIRTWHKRPYNDKAARWAVERFVNIIGYRLLEMAQENRYQDAESALRLLAYGSNLGDREGIFRLIATGLDRNGEDKLAAVAYTLSWTTTRGGNGFLTFGGKTDIELLNRATELEPNITCSVLAEEIVRILSTSRYEVYGISQALIYAFSEKALYLKGQSSIDIAFACWNNAYAIIETRAPRVDISDDPDLMYFPKNEDNGIISRNNLDEALALAILGGLAHPGRERKRIALLAAQLLLEEKSKIAAPIFGIALVSISDPATLTWLLKLIEQSLEKSFLVRKLCHDELCELTSRNHLTVRTLARHLIIGDKPPIAPPTSAAPELIQKNNNVILIPNSTSISNPKIDKKNLELIESVAGERMQRIEKLLPGFRNAVLSRVGIVENEESFKRKIKSQIEWLSDRVHKRWPDAFFAYEQLVEETLQLIAAGGRTAHLIDGEPISNPILYEDKLASKLLNNPTLSLLLEAQRQPRPNCTPPPGKHHILWNKVFDCANGKADNLIIEAKDDGEMLCATISIQSSNKVQSMKNGPYKGWYWLGINEKRSIQNDDKANLYSESFKIFEVRNFGDRQALLLPPCTNVDLQMWKIDLDYYTDVSLFDTSQPIIGVDHDLKMLGDSKQNLGAPESLLVPTFPIIAALNLHPGAPFTFEDDQGVGLALVTWRSEYDISEYYLAWPRLNGSGIVIRSDLFSRLVSIVGKDRLTLRDYIIGDRRLLSFEDSPTH